jgi:hypothetical protein
MIRTLLAASALAIAFAHPVLADDMMKCDDASMMKMKADLDAMTGDAMMAKKEMAMKEMDMASDAMKAGKMDDCTMHMGEAMKAMKMDDAMKPKKS